MARIKKCLDTGCTEFIWLDDGRTIIQPKDVCDIKSVPKDYKEQFAEVGRNSKQTIYVSERLIKDVRVGKKIDL